MSSVQLNIRVTLLIAIVAMLFVTLLVRLADIQLVRGSYFRVLADENRFFTRQTLPDRGVILDRYGQPLTLNGRHYIRYDQVFSLYQQGTVIDRAEALATMATEAGRVGYLSSREYPFGAAIAPVIGHLGTPEKADLENDATILPTQLVGKMGLERSWDRRLRGLPGKETLEINARGVPQRTITEKAAVPGQNITSTLDAMLSQIAYQALGEQQGSVIISDASTGGILALVTKPTFDPSIFSAQPTNDAEVRLRAQQMQQMFNDERQLFFNRAISGSYPPGSIFKLVTALAGLESGAIDPAVTVDDQGILKVGEYEYRNWYFTQYGRTEGLISLQRALARSNDIYFYKAAEWIGPDTLAEMARQFGFGKPPGSGLGAEAAGLVPDPAWKEKTLGERWYLGNTYHFGIGQGDLLVSPLQINQLIQALANQSRLCTPSLEKGPLPICRELGFQPQHTEVVMKGMLDACSTGGTAFPFFAYNEQHRQSDLSAEAELWRGAVACKTGTAEFGGIVDAQGHRRTHGWFVAIVEPQLSEAAVAQAAAVASVSAQVSSGSLPALEYQAWREKAQANGLPKRLVITVMVESDEQTPYKEGSREAAPIAKAILDWILLGKSPQNQTTPSSAEAVGD